MCGSVSCTLSLLIKWIGSDDLFHSYLSNLQISLTANLFIIFYSLQEWYMCKMNYLCWMKLFEIFREESHLIWLFTSTGSIYLIKKKKLICSLDLCAQGLLFPYLATMNSPQGGKTSGLYSFNIIDLQVHLFFKFFLLTTVSCFVLQLQQPTLKICTVRFMDSNSFLWHGRYWQ